MISGQYVVGRVKKNTNYAFLQVVKDIWSETATPGATVECELNKFNNQPAAPGASPGRPFIHPGKIKKILTRDSL